MRIWGMELPLRWEENLCLLGHHTMWRGLTQTLTWDLKPDLSLNYLVIETNKQTDKKEGEREKKKFTFLSKKIWIGFSAIAIKRFPIDAGNNILWYSSKNMGLEWGNLCLRHSLPTKKLCVSAYDALFVILQFSWLKKGHCLIFITGLLWGGGYIIYMIRVAFEGRERAYAQQGMIPCRPKPALFCPLGYSKAFQSFLRLAPLAITHGQRMPFMCQVW